MRFPIATATTAGPFTIDVYEHWVHEWVTAWADLGQLVEVLAIGAHITHHEPFLDGPCHCWSCKVHRAWSARHAQ